jgi:hypothetical protein
MKILEGDILPGIGIGNFKLGITRDELLSRLGDDYMQRESGEGGIIDIGNASFWIGNDGRVNQIGVSGDFKGKYKEVMGLGTIAEDVKKYVDDYVEVWDGYELENVRGICFQLGDAGDDSYWDEQKAPIEWIGVFLDEIDETGEGVLDEVAGKRISDISVVGHLVKRKEGKVFQYDLKDMEKIYKSGGLSKEKVDIEYRTGLDKIYIEFEDILVKFGLYNQNGRLRVEKVNDISAEEQGRDELSVKCSIMDLFLMTPALRGGVVKETKVEGGTEKYCRRIRIVLESGQEIRMDSFPLTRISIVVGMQSEEVK